MFKKTKDWKLLEDMSRRTTVGYLCPRKGCGSEVVIMQNYYPRCGYILMWKCPYCKVKKNLF
jgi:hypothetical protein